MQLKMAKTQDDKAQDENRNGTEIKDKIRTLLALWDLGGEKEEVKRSDLTKRVKRTNEKTGHYEGVFEQLKEAEAIALTTKNRSVKVSLNDKGLQMLGEGLKSTDFEFNGNQVGAKVANALLNWIRQMDGATVSPSDPSKPSQVAITSYEEFKPVALEVYDQLNRDYNLDDLVPIYRLRRQIGDQVSRSQFNEWLLEMQANDILQLQGGSLLDGDSAKIEDSITTEVSGLRCYIKRLA